jgi:hypothetical protein
MHPGACGSEAGGTFCFFYDGSTLAGETDAAGNLTCLYIPGVGFSRGNTGYYRENGIGSSLAVTDMNGALRLGAAIARKRPCLEKVSHPRGSPRTRSSGFPMTRKRPSPSR